MTVLKAKSKEQIKKDFDNAKLYQRLDAIEWEVSQVINKKRYYWCETRALIPQEYNYLVRIEVYKVHENQVKTRIHFFIVVANNYKLIMLLKDYDVIKDFNELNYEAFEEITNYFENLEIDDNPES